ncbi:MAG: hypothetical protein AB7O52_08255 [Planctomycetota bacterium]
MGDSEPTPHDLEIRRLTSLGHRYSLARLVGFGLLVAALFSTSRWGVLAWALAAVVFGAFCALVVGHERTRRASARIQGLRTLHRERVARVASRRGTRVAPAVVPGSALGEGARVYAADEGEQPLDPGVIDDLGLVSGPRSLFAFLDVSNTVFGARRLRRRLTHPLLDVGAIRSRQQFVAELASRTEVRTRVLEALLPLRRFDFDSVYPLLDAPGVFAQRRALLWTAQVLGTITPLAWATTPLLPPLILLAAPLSALQMGLIGRHLRESNPARDRALLFLPLLSSLRQLADELGGLALESREARELVAVLTTTAAATRRLHRVLRWLSLRSLGVFFELFNLVTLWELRLLPIIEADLERHRASLNAAMGALGELEATLSLALPIVEQSGFCWPEPIGADQPFVEAEALGHPLLESDRVVTNEFRLGPDPRVLIVTGSNMAGKSTYLRAIGTNLVLAAAGAPVCAGRLRWTPIPVYSDVNIRDSLDDGKSYFQVEVERVRDVLRVADRGRMFIAIFDELFRGTNSVERLAISQAIVRRLRDAGGLAIVATHDLRLTDLATVDHEPGIANVHFAEHLDGAEMYFDYRVQPGPARSRNAIRVLEASGFPPAVVAEADRRAGRG